MSGISGNISAAVAASICALPLLAGPAYAQTVMVSPGDTLAGIAREQLGEASRWPELCAANQELLNDCDLLPIGVELVIPGNDVSPGDFKAIVAGPIALDAEWIVKDLRLAPGAAGQPSSVTSEVSLLRAGVYDHTGRQWLAPPKDYVTSADGSYSVAFTTPEDSSAVRVYPLRAIDSSGWAYKVFPGLAPSTSYVASWVVSVEDDEYRITDLTIAKAGQ